MKVVFPTLEDQGLNSPVFGHFGSAPVFLVVNMEDGSLCSLINADQDHMHGQCQPMKALQGMAVDAVVVGGIGGGALSRLTASGIRTYRAVEGTVAENLDLLTRGRLPEFMPFETCAGHGPGGHCAH